MGNQPTKSNLGSAITYLNICAEPIKYRDDKFWDKILNHEDKCGSNINISIQEIRMLRDGSSKNLATLTCKLVERIHMSTKTLCNTHGQQVALLNATRILTKLLPCIFEDSEWRSFFIDNQLSSLATNEPELKFPVKGDRQKNFKAYLPLDPGMFEPSDEDSNGSDTDPESFGCEYINRNNSIVTSRSTIDKTKYYQDSLLRTLVVACCDLLFCPEFTVPAHNDNYLSKVADVPPEDLQSLASCDYVWEPGVGFESNINSTTNYDNNKIEILRLLLACFSQTLYLKPKNAINERNLWLETFITKTNRHALPLFTSLLNTVLGYKPPRCLPLNNVLYNVDNRLRLVEIASQILIISLDYEIGQPCTFPKDQEEPHEHDASNNLFAVYMSRIHRVEDFNFMVDGLTRLLNNQLEKGYLLNSSQNINLEQELLVLFWKICNINKNFMNFLLKSQEVLDIIVPILYHMNINFQNETKTALIHLGVFNLLVLSGERNFAVRLNKQHLSTILPNLPTFTGTHADLMIIVFHKLILYGYNLYQLFDYMTTIIVNISPYIKALSMVACKCLVQLFEIFSSPEVIFTEPGYHQMVVNLLETFNNVIQYQFDGNANLICAIMTHKEAFVNLKNLPSSESGIQRVLNRLIRARDRLYDDYEKQLTTDNETKQEDSCHSIDQDKNIGKKKVNSTISTSLDTNGKCLQFQNESTILNATLSNTSITDHSNQNNRVTNNLQQHNAVNDSNNNNNLHRVVCLVVTPSIGDVVRTINPIQSSFNDLQQVDIRFSPTTSSASGRKLSPTDESLYDDPIDKILNWSTGSQDFTNNEFDPTETKQHLDTESMLIENDKPIRRQISRISSSSSPKASSKGVITENTKKRTEIGPQSGSSSTPPSVRRNKWFPNPDHIKEWKKSLPMHTTLRTIEVLSPQIDQFKDDTSGKFINDFEIIKFVQNGTLVGLLPVPHPILTRRYKTNQETSLWFRVCTWGIIFVKQCIWTGTTIRLMKPCQLVSQLND